MRVPLRLNAIGAFMESYKDGKLAKIDCSQEQHGIERSLAWTLSYTNDTKFEPTRDDAKALMLASNRLGEQFLFQVATPLIKEICPTVSNLINSMDQVMEASRDGKISSANANRVCQDILNHVFPKLRLQRQSFIVRPYSSDLSPDHFCNKSALPLSSDIVTLFRQCETLSFDQCVADLLGILHDVARKPSGSAFSQLLFPILKKLPPLPTSDPNRYKSLFSTVLQSYVLKCIQGKPKLNWWRNGVKCTSKKTCQECRSLGLFLKSEKEQISRTRPGSAECKHLERVFANHPDCRAFTNRDSSPMGFVVEKTMSKSNQEMQAYRARIHSVEGQLVALGHQKLKQMLGAEYKNIMQTFAIQQPAVVEASARQPAVAAASGRQPLQDASVSNYNYQSGTQRPYTDASTGLKRKAEVIDLEDE